MKSRVLVLGDTVAGLTTALRLSTAGFQVHILKLQGQSGEGSFSSFPPAEFSNSRQIKALRDAACKEHPPSPLICYGSHIHTDSFIKELGMTNARSAWHAVPLEFMTEGSTPVRFLNSPLPAPWHTVLGILNFSAIPLSQRWHLINFIEKVWEGVVTLPNTLNLETAKTWLTTIGQPDSVQNTVWNPLCRFLLGTNLTHTHAGSFVTMAKNVFFQSRKHGPQLSTMRNFVKLFTNTLTERLLELGVHIDSAPTTTQLQVEAEHITGLEFSDHSRHHADWYVSALSPASISGLLPERLLARYSSFQQLNQTIFAPMVAVHLETNLKIKKPRLLLHNGSFSWTLCQPNRLSDDSSTLLSCVSTDDPTLLSLPDEQINSRAKETLQLLFSKEGDISTHVTGRPHIQRHPLGFIPHLPGITPARPSHLTPVRNLLLAGSWTDTGASTELESAIVSGELCAQTVLAQSSQTN